MRFETIMIDADKDVITDDDGKLHYTEGGDKLFYAEKNGYYSAFLVKKFKDVLKEHPCVGEKKYEDEFKKDAEKAINKLTVD